jgi:hypothetical protein
MMIQTSEGMLRADQPSLSEIEAERAGQLAQIEGVRRYLRKAIGFRESEIEYVTEQSTRQIGKAA